MEAQDQSLKPPKPPKRLQRLEEAVKDLKPQLGRTAALAEDLKRQVKRLAADYSEIAAVLGGR